MSQWKLVDTGVAVDVKVYNCCAEPYESLMLSFTMQRSLSTSSVIITPTLSTYKDFYLNFLFMFFFFNILISYFLFLLLLTIVIMVLTLLTFFVPPAVGTKVLVGVINLAILCAYLLYFHSSLPYGNAPLIGTFYDDPLIRKIITELRSLTHLVSFYNGSLIMVIISIATSILSLRFVRLPGSVPPAFIQKCLASRIGLFLGISHQVVFI